MKRLAHERCGRNESAAITRPGLGTAGFATALTVLAAGIAVAQDSGKPGNGVTDTTSACAVTSAASVLLPYNGSTVKPGDSVLRLELTPFGKKEQTGVYEIRVDSISDSGVTLSAHLLLPKGERMASIGTVAYDAELQFGNIVIRVQKGTAAATACVEVGSREIRRED